MVTSRFSPGTRLGTGGPTLSTPASSHLRKVRYFLATGLVVLAGCLDELGPTDLSSVDVEGEERAAAASDPQVGIAPQLMAFHLGEPYDLAAVAGPNAEAVPEPPRYAQFPFIIRPKFQMPFYYHQTWLASTYNGHYPNQNSIDLRRYSGGVNISEGAPVVASVPGTIAEVGPVLSPEGDYYGDYVYIDHGLWQTRYLHIKKVASWAPGMAIERGQLVGTVGRYHDMEPHLHYTQLLFGQAVRVYFNGVAIGVHAGAEKPDGSYPTQNLTSNNAPTGCTVTNHSVKCDAGAAVRAVAECLIPQKAIEYTRRGSWAPAKVTSTATCTSGLSLGFWYETS